MSKYIFSHLVTLSTNHVKLDIKQIGVSPYSPGEGGINLYGSVNFGFSIEITP